MKMNLLKHLIPLALLFLGALPPAAAAQTMASQVEAELERTDRRIEQAQAVVGDSENEEARAELGEAVRVQGDARGEYGQRRYRMALDLTLRARGRADRAIAIVKRLPDPDRVTFQLERTRELLERARERVEECGRDQARAMIRASLEMQRRAEDAAGGGHYLAALQLTMGARERAHRALRMCDLEDTRREDADRAIQRTEEILQRAHDRVGDPADRRARDFLSQAVDRQNRARREFEAERYEPALRFTLQARNFAHRAMRHGAR